MRFSDVGKRMLRPGWIWGTGDVHVSKRITGAGRCMGRHGDGQAGDKGKRNAARARICDAVATEL